ncbi:MAG: DUF2723 domain-containing protein [Deltaproteobacteria bacterium]|nr:DUF2723 domain-containing protein [Deltaproteobacteria bacterium]
MKGPLGAGWTAPRSGALSTTTAEVLAWGVLLAAVTASRILVAPDVLYDWDSANYALAITDFDVYEHQPHPPGNPVFMAMLWAFRWLPGGPTAPFLAVNALLGAGTLLLLGAMVRRDGGRVLPWVVALLFAVCPPFWYQGAVASAYVAECFTSVLVAATALGVARRRVPLWLAGVLFALALGIRPNSVLSMGPLALLGVWMGRASRAEVARGLAAFVAVTLLWVILEAHPLTSRVASLALLLAVALVAGCSDVYCETGDTAIIDTTDTAYQGARRRAPDAGWRLRVVRPGQDLSSPKSEYGE